MYRPLPKGLTIMKSRIDGIGLFATMDIPSDYDFGISHVPNSKFENGYIRTPLGGFINHSDNPNCKVVTDVDGNYRLVSTQFLSIGDEITLKYNLYKIK